MDTSLKKFLQRLVFHVIQSYSFFIDLIANSQIAYILVIIDYLTSWLESAAIETITAEIVMKEFFHLIISRHGRQTELVNHLRQTYAFMNKHTEIYQNSYNDYYDLTQGFGVRNRRSSCHLGDTQLSPSNSANV